MALLCIAQDARGKVQQNEEVSLPFILHGANFCQKKCVFFEETKKHEVTIEILARTDLQNQHCHTWVKSIFSVFCNLS